MSSLTSVLAREEGHQTDYILFQPKRFEDLSGPPPHANPSAYFREFGSCLVDIDLNFRGLGQSKSEGQSADTPAARVFINKHPKDKNQKKLVEKKYRPNSNAKLAQ
jgi:hypothetical protein